MNPDGILLKEFIDRIVSASRPERIILFGSAAKGTMGEDSDIDVLVIKSNVHRGKTTDRIYRSMKGVGRPVDVFVAHPQDLEKYGESPALVYSEALRSGRVVYDT